MSLYHWFLIFAESAFLMFVAYRQGLSLSEWVRAWFVVQSNKKRLDERIRVIGPQPKKSPEWVSLPGDDYEYIEKETSGLDLTFIIRQNMQKWEAELRLKNCRYWPMYKKNWWRTIH